MGHQLQVFAGRFDVLSALAAGLPMARLFALTHDAEILVLPLEDDLHDALHARYESGIWLTDGPLLTTGDVDHAAELSRIGPIAYLETNYFGGGGVQSAIAWRACIAVVGPRSLKLRDEAGVPRGDWPINAALQALGVGAGDHEDAFAAFGLGFYRSNEDIWSMARGQDPRRAPTDL